MKVYRTGTGADHGQKSVNLDDGSFSWSKSESRVAGWKGHVLNFYGESHHDYTVLFSLDDIIKMLNVVATESLSDPIKFEKQLEPALKVLVQLQAVASGLKR